jgi:hypothetical protein
VARGYLLKDSVEAALLKAIRATYARHTFSASRIARMLLEGDARGLDAHAAEHRYALLTVRERGNKDIARLLRRWRRIACASWKDACTERRGARAEHRAPRFDLLTARANASRAAFETRI